jgi:GT2 family glycosyltransferase
MHATEFYGTIRMKLCSFDEGSVVMRRKEAIRKKARASSRIDTGKRYDGAIAPLSPGNISLIVPVKDNQMGVDRLVNSVTALAKDLQPAEMIIVDNGSRPPIELPGNAHSALLPLRLVVCDVPGISAARNAGVKVANSDWVLFTDSDCVATKSTISGYASPNRPAVAYAGVAKGVPAGTRLSSFYDSELTLSPPMKLDAENVEVPISLVGANMLIMKEALIRCGGFDERFAGVGGEDVEFGLRLWNYGNISRCERSVVLHEFNDGLTGFWARFVRYGRGNKALEQAIGLKLNPRWSRPVQGGFPNLGLKILQHVALCVGYYVIGTKRDLGSAHKG